ncbi:DUF1801 domain-containing protein [Chryseobacterium sp. TY4]
MDGKNIIILGPFKDFCVLSFFKGVLLEDPKNLLEQIGKNSQSSRVVRITNLDQIPKHKTTIEIL